MLHSAQYAPNHDTTNLVESLSVMIEQESTTYSCHDYLSSDHECANNKITPDDRMKIVDWCYGIVDRCQFKRESVAVAMNIVDRFMCASASAPQAQDALYHRGKYQLVAVTALYMSIKVNECTAFGINDFALMSHGTYSAGEIKDMEWAILQGLSWRVCPPTSLQVGHHILALMLSKLREKKTSLEQGTWDFVHEEVAFQLECSVRDYYFTIQRPTTIAIAAILNVIEQVSDHDYTLLILSLLPLLQDFDLEQSNVLKEAMDKLLCRFMVNENSEIDSDLDVLETNPEGPEALDKSYNRDDSQEENAVVDSSVRRLQESESLHSSCRDVACTDNCADFCITEDIEEL